MKYRLDQLKELARDGKLSVSEKPRKKASQPAVRNAPEHLFPQSQQTRKDVHSSTEKEALQRIDRLHTTPHNNIANKRPALLLFHKISPQGKPNVYQCELPDGYYIIVEKRDGHPLLPFMAHYEVSRPIRDSKFAFRATLTATGVNYTDAVAHLLAIPQFKNPHSVRWLNFYHLCAPHIHIPGNKNSIPSNPGKIPTQKIVDSLNIPAALGEEKPETQSEIVFTLHMPRTAEQEYNNFKELREALERREKPFENPLHADYTEQDRMDRTRNYAYYGVKR